MAAYTGSDTELEAENPSSYFEVYYWILIRYIIPLNPQFPIFKKELVAFTF